MSDYDVPPLAPLLLLAMIAWTVLDWVVGLIGTTTPIRLVGDVMFLPAFAMTIGLTAALGLKSGVRYFGGTKP
jgi:hypothetical protein